MTYEEVKKIRENPKCYFVRVLSGEKTFEVRENDRDYKRGDLLALNEMEDGVHTGRSCIVRVDYILDNPNYCKSGFVVMSIKPLAESCDNKELQKMIDIAIEKQIPKKQKGQMRFCGKCNCGGMIFSDMNYCSHCGQALDWNLKGDKK